MALLRKLARRVFFRLLGIKGSDFLPDFHPGGVQLMPVEVGHGCYALLSDKPPVTNAGFVVGETGVVVVDAHINGNMAHQIQDLVASVTSKPIMYLVNTSYHGDHTFGNYAFPATTQIVAHKFTAERMNEFEEEFNVILRCCRNDRDVLKDVTVRLPDRSFDHQMDLDIGGRRCTVHHFGHGNTSGDAVLCVPDARVAFTGNFVSGEGSLPVLRDGKARQFRETLWKFSALPVDKIVPGHSLPSALAIAAPFDRMLASSATLERYRHYLDGLCEPLEDAVNNQVKLQDVFKRLPLPEQFLEHASRKEAMQLRVWHRFNVARCYQFASQANV